MNEAIVLHMDKLWFLFEGESARVVPEFPRLDGPAVVITDFGGALCGVAAVGGRSAYAEALIGRRLRDEGLIDGEARVLVHHVLKDGGGFQALYTAVPIDIWQRMMSWAQAQQETCLIVPQAAAMCQVLPRGDQGVIFRHKRRLSLLLRRREGLGYFSVLSLSDGREDLLASVKTLANRFLERSSAAEPTVDFRWFSLSGPGVADEDEGLCAAFAQATGARATRVDVSLFHGENGECRAALEALSPALSERIAVNPLAIRFECFAKRNLVRAGCCAGLAAAVFVLGGVSALWQAEGVDAQIGQDRARARAIMQRIQTDIAAPSPGKDFYTTRALVDRISGAQLGVDPYSFLRNLRLAAGERVKLLRVSLGKEIVVEGWVDQTGGDDGPLAAFVTQLRHLGFSLEAVDAPSDTHARRSGFFAYRLLGATENGEGS